MRIVCPNCSAEYFLEADQVDAAGTTAQCSACNHTFVAHPEPGEVTDVVPTEPDGHAAEQELGGAAAESSGDGQVWYLAQGGRVYKVKDLATLQRWVVEKRVLPTDRISNDGQTWTEVTQRADLRPFFAILEQLKVARTADERSAAPTSASEDEAMPGQDAPQAAHVEVEESVDTMDEEDDAQAVAAAIADEQSQLGGQEVTEGGEDYGAEQSETALADNSQPVGDSTPDELKDTFFEPRSEQPTEQEPSEEAHFGRMHSISTPAAPEADDALATPEEDQQETPGATNSDFRDTRAVPVQNRTQPPEEVSAEDAQSTPSSFQDGSPSDDEFGDWDEAETGDSNTLDEGELGAAAAGDDVYAAGGDDAYAAGGDDAYAAGGDDAYAAGGDDAY
ncbi:MAG: hypothetical protein CL928_13450, partial [Deltaproteobacteria bacterium]|nr:hypothetical protein [Deltaproteobacteria bacterium]